MARRVIFTVLMLVVVSFFYSCSEKLPEGPGTELEDVLLVRLTTDFESYAQENTYRDEYNVPEGMDWPEFNQKTAWKVYFRVRLENTFDEPVVGTKYVDATIRVWDKNDATKKRTLTVLDTLSADRIIIQPGEIYTVFSGEQFVWDQTGDQGEPFASKDTFTAYTVQEHITYNKYTNVYYRHCDTLTSFLADSVKAFGHPIQIQAQATVQLFQEYRGTYWTSDIIEFPIVFLSHEGWPPVTEVCKEGYFIKDPP